MKVVLEEECRKITLELDRSVALRLEHLLSRALRGSFGDFALLGDGWQIRFSVEAPPGEVTKHVEKAEAERDKAMARVAVLDAFVRAWDESHEDDLSVRLEIARAAAGEVPCE